MNISQEVRRFVTSRALECCEYCLLPQLLHSHHVDHIIARQHGGVEDLENLALCCMTCNLYKGTNLTTIDPETKVITTLFNPRKQVWSQHFVLEQGGIIGVTPEGRATVFLLRFNDETRVQQRFLLIQQGTYRVL
jgi:hypothetical protein